MLSTEMNSAAPMKRPKLSTDATMKAAGLMIVTKQGRALFLRRRNKGRFEGEWAWPGGKIEDGETPEEAARRETREEIKWEPESEVREIDNNVSDRSVDFTTFRTEVDDEFIPKLNEEHVGYAWASLDDPPEPLHPGCRRVIDMAMDALDKAKFEEGKHPRGQPENAGQFGTGGGGGKAQPEAKEAPERPAERQEGETDKQFAKRVVDKRPPPKELPENYSDYFHTEGAQVIPLDKLVSTKTDEENAQGAENGAKRMEAAAKGELGKRGPIEVKKMPDGKFQIVDGNGTYSSVKKYGWKGIPAKLSEGKTSFKPGIVAQGLENATTKKKQWAEISPIKTAEDLWSEGAVKNQEALAKVSAPIAQKLGLMFKDPGIKGASDKGKARIQEKIEEGKPPNRINDGVRAGFRINTPKQSDQIVEELAKHFEIADEGWEVTDAGYFDRKVMVRFEDGQVGEVQIWHPELLDVKENKGHKLYEDWRTLRKQMATGEIPPDDPRSAQLVKQMREVYSQVHKGMSPDWLSLLGRGGSVPMEGGGGKPGNMDSKRALDSKAACIDTSMLGASRHSPLRKTNAFSGPGKYKAGSPSHEQYLIDSSVILDSFQILKRFENRTSSTYIPMSGEYEPPTSITFFSGPCRLGAQGLVFDEKLSKEEARYTDGPVDTEPCKRCSMYRDLFCTAVVGEISPNGHCRLWESDGRQPAQDAEFKESDHPRGQPGNAGQFGSGGGSKQSFGGNSGAGTYEFKGKKQLNIPPKKDETGTLSDNATGWLDGYINGIELEAGQRNPVPSDEVVKELDKYRPKSTLLLYRAHTDDPNRQIESWSKYSGVAENIVGARAESDPGIKMIWKRVTPDEVLIDTTKLPRKFRDSIDITSQDLSEVIVASGDFLNHVKSLRSKTNAKDAAANEATEKELRTTIKYPPPKSNSQRVIDQSFARGGLKQGESLRYAPKAQAYENRGGHDSVAKDQAFVLAYDKSILVNLGNGLYVKAPRECLAFDARTARFYDKDARLHLAVSNISKAVVNPYLGKEIPEFEQLGLEPNRIYRLYRDPQELAKAAPTFNGIPVLSEHVAVDAMNHRPDLVIGATGTDANFANPYLQNSLVFWDGNAIQDIESEDKKELSSAYRYRADMTPGTIQGENFDGVMRDLIANHVALVKEGRAGSDVVVGDSKEKVKMPAKVKPRQMSRQAAIAVSVLSAHLRPKLAKDASIPLFSLLEGVTATNFREKKPGILSGLKSKLKFNTAEIKKFKGKPKIAMDATIGEVAELLDMIENHGVEGDNDDMIDVPKPVEQMAQPVPEPGMEGKENPPMLPEGSPAEEAGESPEQESAEMAEGAEGEGGDPSAEVQGLLAGKVDDATLAKVMEIIKGAGAHAHDEPERQEMAKKEGEDAEGGEEKLKELGAADKLEEDANSDKGTGTGKGTAGGGAGSAEDSLEEDANSDKGTGTGKGTAGGGSGSAEDGGPGSGQQGGAYPGGGKRDDAAYKGPWGRSANPPAAKEHPEYEDADGNLRKFPHKGAKDEPPPFKGMPKPGGTMVTQDSMTAAIKAATDSERKNQRAIREAERVVRPLVGEMSIAFDSADEVYKNALTMLGVKDADKIHPSAYPQLLDMCRQTRQHSSSASPIAADMAMDEGDDNSYQEMFPEADHIGVV